MRAPHRRLRRFMLVCPMVLVGGGSLLLAMSGMRASPKAAEIVAECDAWDRAASQRVAALVGDSTAAGELRFDEALAQLRRARKYCRSGFASVALGDYRALERAVPDDTTASISMQAR
jgi:hypothetical protein